MARSRSSCPSTLVHKHESVESQTKKTGCFGGHVDGDACGHNAPSFVRPVFNGRGSALRKTGTGSKFSNRHPIQRAASYGVGEAIEDLVQSATLDGWEVANRPIHDDSVSKLCQWQPGIGTLDTQRRIDRALGHSTRPRRRCLGHDRPAVCQHDIGTDNFVEGYAHW